MKDMKKLTFLLLCLSIFSCTDGKKKLNKENTDEIEDYFESIKDDKPELKSFFQKMPKGGDIHHHASGTPYAEDYIQNALKDSCFISTVTYQLYFDKKDAFSNNDNNAVLINTLLENNPNEKDSIINNWSVRDYKKRNKDGHDLFFSTFEKFKPAFVGHESELLSKICQKASKDNISYIETMISVPNIQDSVAKYADNEKWNFDDKEIEIKLKELYKHYKDNHIDKWAQINADSLDSYYNKTNNYGVKLKFQTYGTRVSPNQQKIFGHLLLAFETALLTDNLVGVNFVAPEDNSYALKNYELHMQMFSFLSKKYPSVNISLHAGELILGKGSVKDIDLKFHINSALKTAKATRIGHGVDLINEDDYIEILDFMKKNKCAVEINLESNEVILETTPINHPINIYLKNKIPICISTDDEGVLRTNLTNQYLLLIEYVPNITYAQIKQIVFNSIEYSFLNQQEKKEMTQILDKNFKTFQKK
jgi:adenosine deaminase